MKRYVFRVEYGTAPDGTRYCTAWRRAVLSESAKFIELGEVERATFEIGKPASPDWETAGGLLGRGCHLTRERYRACGYSERPPAEIQK